MWMCPLQMDIKCIRRSAQSKWEADKVKGHDHGRTKIGGSKKVGFRLWYVHTRLPFQVRAEQLFALLWNFCEQKFQQKMKERGLQMPLHGVHIAKTTSAPLINISIPIINIWLNNARINNVWGKPPSQKILIDTISFATSYYMIPMVMLRYARFIALGHVWVVSLRRTFLWRSVQLLGVYLLGGQISWRLCQLIHLQT